MRFLPFEHRYALDGAPCDRCSATGQYPRPGRHGSRDCLNCRGLGRKLTRAARRLYIEICERLGSPNPFRESRIRANYLDLVIGKNVRAGMAVAPYGDRGAVARRVVRVDRTPGAARVRLEDRTTIGVADYESLRRELTPAELALVDGVLADHLGRGAVSRRSLLPRRRA